MVNQAVEPDGIVEEGTWIVGQPAEGGGREWTERRPHVGEQGRNRPVGIGQQSTGERQSAPIERGRQAPRGIVPHEACASAAIERTASLSARVSSG